ncbi:tetratricopeptide repeat protein [Planobispora longispora]|uniref:nSTAND1 domain-containing NTPase n=1 Tax=Planobispora longispora TaxID=28887 RepID=UPI0019442928|nr:tetratricopeptide repeat protein [Planobispora longispora]
MATATRREDRAIQPYVGLRPYEQSEHPLFFGRAQESRDIATVWQATGLTVLYGASGVGKTSLLNAGILPRIDSERADVLPVARVAPGGITVLSPRVPGNPYILALLSAWSPEEPLSSVVGLTVSEFLYRRPKRADQYGDPVPILAAIDQAEELFSGPVQRETEREDLLKQLAQAVEDHDGLHLLLSLREEHVAAVLPYERPLGHGSRTRFHLRPLKRAAALDAATKPLEYTARSFAPGAAELLIDDLRTVEIVDDEGRVTEIELDVVEPVQLQIVCSSLWESLPPELTEITEEHVHLHVDVDRFLTGFCKDVLTRVAAEQGVPVTEIQYWLRNNFVTEHGTRHIVNEGLQKTAGMPNAVARALEDCHLLKAEHRLGTRWYELQHDRLIAAVRQPERPATYLVDARAALARQDWETAGKLADEAIRAAEFDEVWVQAEAQEILGKAAAARGEIVTARHLFRKAAETFSMLQQFDGVARALTADGLLWLAQRDYAMAVEVLKSALSWAPNDPPTQLALGQALWRLGQPRAALTFLNGTLALADRPPAEALALRGEIHADMDMASEALRDLNRVRENQEPGTVAARALALALAGRFDAAEQEMLDALAAESGSGPVMLRAARVNALLGREAKAAELVSRALGALDPALPPHLRKQGEELARRLSA